MLIMRGNREISMPRRRQDLDVAQLTRIVTNDQSHRDLQHYYGIDLRPGELPPFTGGRFELLDDGGDRTGMCNRFTAPDILSLELLGVQLPPRVALGLLEGALGEDAAAFLERIPTSVPLWDERAGKLIERGGPADGLWRLLKSQDGVGWVMAGKLLARKRPSLIPVYDEIVRCAFGWPENIWTALQDALRQDDGSFRTVLEDLKKQAGVPQQVSLLRTLDVAIWMRHRPLHTGHRCTGLM
jgi:hypothetical protein